MSARIKPYLLEALDLVVSYAFRGDLPILALELGENSHQLEDATFALEFRARHAVACAISLKPILGRIEQNFSTLRGLCRANSVSGIHGALDVQTYISSGTYLDRPPKDYPVLISKSSPDTPENRFVLACLRALDDRLTAAPFGAGTIEAKACGEWRSWLHAHLRRPPWRYVTCESSIESLQLAAAHRIRKRQMSNSEAYRTLLLWSNELLLDARYIGGNADGAVQGLLAFPAGEIFENKVFEIWCLSKIVAAMERAGLAIIQGPESLASRSQGPIYTMEENGTRYHVWFQRQKPLGNPRWQYSDTDKGLSGIPDIVIERLGHPGVFAIDAKFRSADAPTRSEETYKMLGYIENFRETLASPSSASALVLVGDRPIFRTLETSDGGRLSLAITQAPGEFADSSPAFDQMVAYFLVGSHKALFVDQSRTL